MWRKNVSHPFSCVCAASAAAAIKKIIGKYVSGNVAPTPTQTELQIGYTDRLYREIRRRPGRRRSENSRGKGRRSRFHLGGSARRRANGAVHQMVLIAARVSVETSLQRPASVQLFWYAGSRPGSYSKWRQCRARARSSGARTSPAAGTGRNKSTATRRARCKGQAIN